MIVGAGASAFYGLPLAAKLLKDARDTVLKLDMQRVKILRTYSNIALPRDIAQGDRLNEVFLQSIKPPLNLEVIARLFREHLVQQNLDDFVRDHPSMTDPVSMLITIALFSKMYINECESWKLKPQFRKSGLKVEEDWMRQFVGIVRPMVSVESRLHIVSFNYDSLLERAMRMYWGGSEYKYATLDEGVEFIYPHGKFSELPDHLNTADKYLFEQSAQLKLGSRDNQVSRDRAKEIIGEAHKIFSVGFSFSGNNLDLLGFTKERGRVSYVQNYKSNDVRLERQLDKFHVDVLRREAGDMNALVRNGFFEQ